MAEGQYKFIVGLDKAELARDIQEVSKQFEKLVKEVEKAGYKLDDSFKNPFDQFKLPPDLPAKTDAVKAQFNGLNVATQQLVRELPAASMGLNTFFLAISNNLPIFADQVKRVNDENKNLASQGKPTVSVLKQIGTSLLSWQTGLVLGVTALSMYGKEIGKWVVSLFKGKDALDAIKVAERDLHEARMTGAVDAQEEATNLRLMVSAMQDASLSMDERKTAMQSLQDMYPEYFGNLTEEELYYGDLTTTVETLTDRLVKLATARNAVNQIVKNEENKALLKGTEGYTAYRNQLGLFRGSGHKKYKTTEDIVDPSGVKIGYRWIETDDESKSQGRTDAYKAFEKVQKDFLKNLKKGNKEQEAIYEQIIDEYDGNVEAYLKALDESNKKLTKTAQGTATDKGLKAAEKEAKDEKTKAERLERKAEQRRKQAETSSVKLAEDVVRARTEATISAMKDGLDKEIAQINADYDAKERDITERENELKKLQGGKLTERQTADFASLRASNEAMRANAIADAQEKANERLNDALHDYYIQYGTLQEKILSTTEKYAILIANAQNEGQRMALEAERDALLAEYQVAASDWAKELADKTTVKLNKMLAKLEAEVKAKNEAFQALDSVDEGTRQDYLDTINKLNAQIVILKTKLSKAVNDDNWAEATQVFQGIASSAREAADGIAGLDENLAYMLRSLADLAGVATNITASIQALGKAVKTVEKASAVLAVIGAVIQAISYIANVFNENAEATRNAAEALAEYESAIARINNASISESYSNIFGKDEYGEFSARLKAAQEYSKALEDIKKKASESIDYGWYRSNKEKQDFNLRMQAGGVMDNTTFIADMRSGWQKFWGSDKNIKTTSLDEFYENGVLNVDKLKAYYDAYKEYLTSEQQLLIEELISNGELLQENLDAITGYLQDKFGQMGQTISDALVDAFENGTDAAEAMGGALTDILEDIAEDMAYSAFIQPLLDIASEQIAELNQKRASGKITEEEFFNQLIGIGTQLMEQMSSGQETYNKYMEAVRRAGDEQGLSMWDGSESSSRDSGFARAPQESIDELSGRATAIQSHTYSIMQNQEQLTRDAEDMLRHLANIDTNTSELRYMRQDMAKMRSDINTIVTQGISMR